MLRSRQHSIVIGTVALDGRADTFSTAPHRCTFWKTRIAPLVEVYSCFCNWAGFNNKCTCFKM